MACSEDLHLPLINPLVTDASPSSKLNGLRNEAPSSMATTIVTVLDSTKFISPISPLRKSDETLHESEHRRIPTRRQITVRHLSMGSISRQLTIRKVLQDRLCRISNITCFLGLLGMILMVVENEITFIGTDNKETIISWFMKLIITISTVILVGFIVYYHRLSLTLYSIQNSIDNWRVGLTPKKLFLISLEIFICAIHPIPRSFPHHLIRQQEEIHLNSTFDYPSTPISVSQSYVAVDVALGLPMFARLYLVCRCIIFHSYLLRDAPSKSLGSLNKISIDFTFLLKTYLERWPARSLMIFCILMFFIGSWSIRACDYKPTAIQHISMFDSMWLFIITFTTVGYGDLTPSTYCGRTVASVIAFIGVLATALLISVVSQKLALTRSEKYVHHFVSDIELNRERRAQAANVVKFAMKVWYLQRNDRLRSIQYIKAQRSLYRSIYILRKIRHEQRKLTDNCLDIVELTNAQRYTSVKTKRIAREVTIIKIKMDKIEEKFADMHSTMNNIQHTLHLLLNKETK